ncbi:MAG: hypothetical protein P4M12_11665 [Gammaproteobacteria bacterium]|nr:hypothetical protein [Gammaproteobacteria bacterium]
MKRIELLNKLIKLEEPVGIITKKLEEYGWDSPCDLVTLKRENLLNILNLYIEGKLKDTEVEDWANAIESREDIGAENGSKELIEESIYELANPYLTENLTSTRAKILREKLVKN